MNDAPAAARYVAGRMSEAEIAEFESQMLSRPDLAADVNVRQRMKAGLQVLEERQELSEIITGVANRRRRMLALAAGIAVAAISASLVVWYQRGDRASHLLAIAPSTISAPRLRLAPRTTARQRRQIQLRPPGSYAAVVT